MVNQRYSFQLRIIPHLPGFAAGLTEESLKANLRKLALRGKTQTHSKAAQSIAAQGIATHGSAKQCNNTPLNWGFFNEKETIKWQLSKSATE